MNSLLSSVNRLIGYSTPKSLSYMWNFGSLAALGLVIQIVTGVILAMWYIPSIDLAFESVNFIMREVSYGWFVRYLHVNGASFFFFVVYCHMARALYYNSYCFPRQHVWYSGIIIFCLMMAAAFFGYVLPWASMSFWAATVITSLLTTVPIFGDSLLTLLWGGFGLGQPTLTRIYCMHFLIPLLIVVYVCIHVYLLHLVGSGDPLVDSSRLHQYNFHPLYTYKDLFGYIVALIIFIYLVCYMPNMVSHPLNYNVADPAVTPPHIVPEWYFLPYYGILRSIPSKGLGVIALICSILFLAILPIIDKPRYVRSAPLRPFYRVIFWVFVVNLVFLGWAAEHPVEYPYAEFCQFGTLIYFSFFILLFLICRLENYLFRNYNVYYTHQKP
jgi:ubiquinol-cytochrome c reductase cytochrome b subunit